MRSVYLLLFSVTNYKSGNNWTGTISAVTEWPRNVLFRDSYVREWWNKIRGNGYYWDFSQEKFKQGLNKPWRSLDVQYEVWGSEQPLVNFEQTIFFIKWAGKSLICSLSLLFTLQVMQILLQICSMLYTLWYSVGMCTWWRKPRWGGTVFNIQKTGICIR